MLALCLETTWDNCINCDFSTKGPRLHPFAHVCPFAQFSSVFRICSRKLSWKEDGDDDEDSDEASRTFKQFYNILYKHSNTIKNRLSMFKQFNKSCDFVWDCVASYSKWRQTSDCCWLLRLRKMHTSYFMHTIFRDKSSFLSFAECPGWNSCGRRRNMFNGGNRLVDEFLSTPKVLLPPEICCSSFMRPKPLFGAQRKMWLKMCQIIKLGWDLKDPPTHSSTPTSVCRIVSNWLLPSQKLLWSSLVVLTSLNIASFLEATSLILSDLNFETCWDHNEKQTFFTNLYSFDMSLFDVMSLIQFATRLPFFFSSFCPTQVGFQSKGWHSFSSADWLLDTCRAPKTRKCADRCQKYRHVSKF